MDVEGCPQMRADQFEPQEWGWWVPWCWAGRALRHTWALQVVAHQPASGQHATVDKQVQGNFLGIIGGEGTMMGDHWKCLQTTHKECDQATMRK